MADPATLATVGIGSTVAGGGIKAFGDYFTGKSQTAMYNYQAGVAAVNAAVAKQDAIYTRETGEVEAQQSGLRTRAQVGATRAGFGAGNLSTTTGSANQVLSSETKIGQTNEAVVRANAAKRAFGYDVAAAGDTAQAGADVMAGHYSRTASGVNIASTILGTVGNVAGKWLQAGQSFGTGSGDDLDNVNPDSVLGRGVYSSSIYN